MEPWLTDLARTLDGWATDKRAVLTESDASLVVGGLSSPDAKTLVDTYAQQGLPAVIEDATDAIVRSEDVAEDFEPFKVTLAKPARPANVSTVLTNTAFKDWLSRPPENTVLWCAQLTAAFETESVRFAPWGDDTVFQPFGRTATARKVVRESGSVSLVPSDLGPWLLREGSTPPWDQTAKIWIDLAAHSLFRCLCNEIETDGALMFRGPPVIRYGASKSASASMSPPGFAALQAASQWVFQIDREVETRHGLLTAELARTNVGSNDAALLFENGSAPALEGAKIALQLGLHKLSLDSLKAMADLRKAVVDETSKLADTTRQLATAVAGALFAGIGIIAARLTVVINGPIAVAAILILGVVLCAYVAAVIISGIQFVGIQRDLRSQWRERLYRFLPDAEYEAMVARPAAKAEKALKAAAWMSGVLATLLLFAVIAVTFVPMTSTKPTERVSDPVSGESAKEETLPPAVRDRAPISPSAIPDGPARSVPLPPVSTGRPSEAPPPGSAPKDRPKASPTPKASPQ